MPNLNLFLPAFLPSGLPSFSGLSCTIQHSATHSVAECYIVTAPPSVDRFVFLQALALQTSNKRSKRLPRHDLWEVEFSMKQVKSQFQRDATHNSNTYLTQNPVTCRPFSMTTMIRHEQMPRRSSWSIQYFLQKKSPIANVGAFATRSG
jgi:hypothetical protein